MSSNRLNVVRVFLFRIDGGDRRKFIAEANDTSSGGGPRDLRVRPQDRFWPFFERMLSRRETVSRPRTHMVVEILIDQIVWAEGGEQKTSRLEIWPHQTKRPNELRMAKVDQWHAHHLIEDDPNGGLSVLMLFQQEDGVIRLFFTTETVLNLEDWDPTIKRFSRMWLKEAHRHRGAKAAFLDIEEKESFTGG